MSESVEGKKPVSRSERIRAWLFLLVVGGPIVYGVATVLVSTPFNRAFNHPVQCTIVGAAKGESRSKSYSGNSYVYVEASDCPGMRYVGERHGLTRAEVAERIDALAGQRVTVDVGYWQAPFSDTLIVGVEGLDLGRQALAYCLISGGGVLVCRVGRMGAPSSLFFGVSGVQVSVGVMVENVRYASARVGSAAAQVPGKFAPAVSAVGCETISGADRVKEGALKATDYVLSPIESVSRIAPYLK